MKLSIIIPAYNVEKYIEKCLLSCLNQNVPYFVYEIIVVNDGSLDNSLTIAESISSRYNNVTIISQKNKGLSAARNTGLDQARGQYIWFVDSDDSIATNCLDKIISRLNGIDILNIQYRNVYENSAKQKDFTNYFEGVKTGEEALCKVLYHTAAQFSIYRTAFLRDNNLKFMVGILHEDVEFKPRAICLAKSISAEKTICYNYLQRTSGSITASYSLKRAKDLMTANKSLYNFSRNMNHDIVEAFNARISMNMNSLLLGYHTLGDKDKKEVIKLLNQNKHVVSCMIHSKRIKYIIEGLFILFFPGLGLKIHKIFV